MRCDEKKIETVCFTGHRQIPYEAAARMPRLLEEVISELCERGATVFRAGGAMGFDTLAALKVLDMKETYPHIRLELILPCRNQTERWDEISRRTYQYILERADRHRFLFDTYFDGCMLERIAAWWTEATFAWLTARTAVEERPTPIPTPCVRGWRSSIYTRCYK
jgi:hypothetical protein